MVGKNVIMLTIVIGTLLVAHRMGCYSLRYSIWSATVIPVPLTPILPPIGWRMVMRLSAVAACAGYFYVLTEPQPAVLAAGAIHGLLAIGLLMHHHLSDIPADLRPNRPR